MKDEHLDTIPPAPTAMGLSWELFATSGNIGYYLLHRELSDDPPRD